MDTLQDQRYLNKSSPSGAALVCPHLNQVEISVSLNSAEIEWEEVNFRFTSWFVFVAQSDDEL